MEDFSNILWLLILAGSTAVSVKAKAKEAKRKAASEPPSARQHMEEPAPVPPRQNLTTSIQETQQEAVCAAYTPVSGTAVFTQLETEDTNPERNGFSAGRANEGSDSDCCEAEVMNDFDLRKAVVWSEILKPKFE